MSRTLVFLAVIALAPIPIHADGPDWIVSTPVARPPGRALAAMAFDSARDRIVLFGGTNGSTFYADTWEWDGSTWVDESPLTGPPARVGHAMAYDSARSRTVLFGGDGFLFGTLADTWEWDGSAWVEQTPMVSPPARKNHRLVYDSVRARVVLFGGTGMDGVYFDDTWEWDGSDWLQMTPGAGPAGRQAQGMTFDSARGHVVLFGGWNGSPLADTWEWDGTTWLERTPASSPSPRGTTMVFDDRRGRVVLFGGWDGSAFLGDTWEWAGDDWAQMTPATSPPARFEPAMACDHARGRVMLFGGMGASGFLSDIWEYSACREDLDCDDGNPCTDDSCDPAGGCRHAPASAGQTTCGTGACRRSVDACLDGVPQPCVPGAPSPELCANGIDDDCDGATDASDADCAASLDCARAAASLRELWPPDRRFAAVSIVGIAGPGGGPVSVQITDIRQDEPLRSGRPGETCADGSGVGTGTANLRAEREGRGDGRVYHIGFIASAAAGATCSGVVSVCVPHDRSSRHACGDQGPAFSSTGSCDGRPVTPRPGLTQR